MANYISGIFLKYQADNKNNKLTFKTFEPVSLDKIDYKITPNQQQKLFKIYQEIGGLKNLMELDVGYEQSYFKIFNCLHMVKETVKSARIKGMDSKAESVFKITTSEQDCYQSIEDLLNLNNIKMLKEINSLVDKFPIGNEMLFELHKILMNDTTSQEKGKFRTTNTWIDSITDKHTNSVIDEYIPCECNTIQDHLNDLYKFINKNDKLDPIIKAGLLHYQYDTIRPFIDANDRVAKALIIISLIKNKIVSGTYISPSILTKSKYHEYDALRMNARTKGEFEPLIDFYLDLICDCFSNSFQNYKEFMEFYLNKKKMITESNSKYSKELMDILNLSNEEYYFKIDDVAKRLNIVYNSAKKYIDLAIELNIIKEWKQNNIGNKKYMNKVLHDHIYGNE